MRRIALVGLLGLLGPVGPTDAAEVFYSWKDSGGNVHFSNVAAPGSKTVDLGEPTRFTGAGAAESPAAESEGSDTAGGPEASPGESDARRKLEEEIRTIDSRLAELAELRTRFAAGTASTGGVGTNAAGVRTPEEEALLEERAALEKKRDAPTAP